MEPRPYAFHKMEALIKRMQDPESGVPVRSQKIFLTSVPSAFIGYDLVEWLMEHLNIEESGEAVHLANQLCQYGYLFPVADCKTLTVKDDNSLYRFQAAYYWPCHHRNPDNVEYAIYLVKRTLRNKQRHALEEYEVEALNSLKKNLQNKWELVTMQAEEQAEDVGVVPKNSGSGVKVGKERKKMDKLVADSQERAYWRVHRPPPGSQPPLEPSPILTLRRSTSPSLNNTELEILKRQLAKSRIKVSQAVESLVIYSKTYAEYDPFFTQPQPSNPWLTDDPSFWQFNQSLVEVPTERRVKRWALSFEDLLRDRTGVEEFSSFLKKEYSHENIRFWLAVKEFRTCAQSQVVNKVNQIYQEFLARGAPCEINIDCKTQEATVNEMKTPSRFTFDAAAHHVYTVLLNKDCYPRFIRSEHYKNLLANALHPPTKKRFFGFGGGGKKKSCAGPLSMTTTVVNKRRGSDRSLTGVIHEAPSFATAPPHPSHTHHVPLSTSQSNLHDICVSGVSPERINPVYREVKQKSMEERKPSSDDERASTSAPSVVVEPVPTPYLDPGPSSRPMPSLNVHLEETLEHIPSSSSSVKSESSSVNPQKNIIVQMSACDLQGDTVTKSSTITLCVTEETTEETTITETVATTTVSTTERRVEPVEVKPPAEPQPVMAPNPPHQPETPKETRRRHHHHGKKSRLHSEESHRSSMHRTTSSETRQISIDLPQQVRRSIEDEDAPPQHGSPSSIASSSCSAAATVATDAAIVGPNEESKHSVQEEGEGASSDEPQKKNHADICPWEDEENCKTEEPFVKKYATLGYL